MKKETRGGHRAGSGRPKKPPTITISFRILPEWELPIRDVIKKTIDRLKKEKVDNFIDNLKVVKGK